MASLSLNHGIYLSDHGFVKEMEVLRRDMVPDLSSQTRATSDLNKLTSYGRHFLTTKATKSRLVSIAYKFKAVYEAPITFKI